MAAGSSLLVSVVAIGAMARLAAASFPSVTGPAILAIVLLGASAVADVPALSPLQKILKNDIFTRRETLDAADSLTTASHVAGGAAARHSTFRAPAPGA